jgi:hypothetical protein
MAAENWFNVLLLLLIFSFVTVSSYFLWVCVCGRALNFSAAERDDGIYKKQQPPWNFVNNF